MKLVKKLLKKINYKSVYKAVASVAAFLSFLYISMNATKWHGDYIINTVGSQIVKLVKPTNHQTGGTGFAIQAQSGRVYTLTNNHVCRLNDEGVMHAEIPGTTRFYELRILERASFTDLCVLEAMPGYSGVPLADNASLGEEVGVVGHPYLYPLTLSIGRLIANQTIQVVIEINGSRANCEGEGFQYLDRTQLPPMVVNFGIGAICIRSVRSIFTNIVIYPGNSGSPAVNFWGNVTGVAFAGDDRTNYAFLIPLRDIKRLLSIY